MKIDINLIKQLRDITQAPFGDCKDALVEAAGDIAQAQEVLKKKGSIKAAKKADRETNHGIVKFITQGDSVIGIRLLCETDFVAKNEKFIALADELLSKIASYTGDIDSDNVPTSVATQLQDFIHTQVASVGENLNLSMVYKKTGKAYVYNHMGNTISAVVFYTSTASDPIDAVKAVALQVAAMNPTYLSYESVPTSVVTQIKTTAAEEMKDMNKPQDIMDKIIEGKIYKQLQEDILLEQASIKDDTKKVKDLLGSSTTIQSFLRVTVG